MPNVRFSTRGCFNLSCNKLFQYGHGKPFLYQIRWFQWYRFQASYIFIMSKKLCFVSDTMDPLVLISTFILFSALLLVCFPMCSNLNAVFAKRIICIKHKRSHGFNVNLHTYILMCKCNNGRYKLYETQRFKWCQF